MQEVIKAKSDADFLAMVPHLLGFRPRDSVVLIGFRGKRTHGALRLDLPNAAVGFKKVAAYALGTMSKIPGLEAIAIVVFTDSGHASHDEFAKVLIGRMERSGFDLRGAWCLGNDGWVSYEDASREVRSLNEIELSDVLISRPEPQPPPVGELPEVSDALKQRVAADLERMRNSATEGDHRSVLITGDQLAVFTESALDWHDTQLLESGGILLYLLQHPNARDAAMLQWASTQQMGEVLWNDIYGALGADLLMGRGLRPQRERVENAIALVARLASVASDADRVAPLCMLAWLHWALGQGSVGGRYLGMALTLNPEHSMANLLNTILTNGMLPEWAFAVESSIADA